MKSNCFKNTVFVLLFFSAQGGYALTLIEPTFTLQKAPEEVFVPVYTFKAYSLLIDSEKSFFRVEKNPESFQGLFFEFNEPAEISEYKVSGQISLSEKHEETGGYRLDETKLTSIDFESKLNNIDLSSSEFWNANLVLVYGFLDKDPGGWICSCETTVLQLFGAPFINAEFNGEALELNGGGIFKEDENDGILQLESGFDATHKVTYHIEASVVSAVPIPAAFYFFFSSIVGLVITRHRYLI